MIIKNSTSFSINAALQEAAPHVPTQDLTVEVKYCPKDSRRYASGTYYRANKKFEDGKLIRLRINRNNRYPLKIHFKTSQYDRRINSRGELIVHQKLKMVKIESPEDLLLAIFLHELSHYVDHIEGRNGRYKETKADKFAVKIMENLGVIPK